MVYQLSCADCDKLYIGETERPLRKRLAEHRRESSPVGLHLLETGHKLAKEKVLDRDARWFQRGVREAIHIRSIIPTLNRDHGRHHLPRTYNPLLLSQQRKHQLHSHSFVTTTNTQETSTPLLPVSEQVLQR